MLDVMSFKFFHFDKNSLYRLENQQKLIYLTKKGINSIKNSLDLLVAMEDLQALHEERKINQHFIDDAKHDAELAQAEIKNGFYLLYSQSIIILWSIIETSSRQLLADILGNNLDIKNIPEIQNLKIKLGEFDSLTLENKNYFIVECLESKYVGFQNRGVNKFENILNLFQIPYLEDSDFDSEDKKTIIELQQTRNCLIHQSGKIDMQYINNCPWIKCSPGDVIEVTEDIYLRFYTASCKYLTYIMNRTSKAFKKT